MKKLFLILMLVAALFIAPKAVMADSSVTFIWTANTTDADLAGYRIYDATTSGAQVINPELAIATIPAGTETATVQLADGPHYFVATAYDTSGNECEKSAEISLDLDSVPPAPVTGFQVTIIVTIVPPP